MLKAAQQKWLVEWIVMDFGLLILHKTKVLNHCQNNQASGEKEP